MIDFLNLVSMCREYNKQHGHVVPPRSTESIIQKRLRAEKRVRVISHRETTRQRRELKARIRGQRERDKLFFGKDTDVDSKQVSAPK